MSHQFQVNASIDGISIHDFKRLAAVIELHENVCQRIPGSQIEILQSELQGSTYTLKRSYNLDVNIPDIAKKLLKDAFRLQRTDVSDLAQMTSVVELGANLPLQAHCERHVTGDEHSVHFHLNWTVKVKVPLIGGMLERHAEKEIRTFSLIEIDVVEDELRQALAAEAKRA